MQPPGRLGDRRFGARIRTRTVQKFNEDEGEKNGQSCSSGYRVYAVCVSFSRICAAATTTTTTMAAAAAAAAATSLATRALPRSSSRLGHSLRPWRRQHSLVTACAKTEDDRGGVSADDAVVVYQGTIAHSLGPSELQILDPVRSVARLSSSRGGEGRAGRRTRREKERKKECRGVMMERHCVALRCVASFGHERLKLGSVCVCVCKCRATWLSMPMAPSARALLERRPITSSQQPKAMPEEAMMLW